jgi:UDP-glucose 4-epimerase
MSEKKKILIIGIAGGLAQMTARLILNEHPEWEILGIDSRDISKVPPLKGLTSLELKYSRGNFENLFRTHQFEVVYHLGRISHSSNTHNILAKRIELSVMGTNRILELCERSQVKKVIILSTFHVYGALPDNSIFLKEDAPLRASIRHPELRDVVFRNVSQRAAEMIKEDLESMGPTKLKDVEKAQQSIVDIVRKLEEEGKIVISGGGGGDQLV